MKRKFIYFINPISGTKGKAVLLEKIQQATNAKHIPFEIVPTNVEGDYNFLQEKIKKEQITDVIVCGGDGTVNQIAKVLQKTAVNIGIIPMGSGNGLAFAAHIPKEYSKALDLIFKGKSMEIDALYINDAFSCMLCGLGFDAQVAHDFAQQKKRGLATYVKQTAKNFLKAQPYPFEISLSGNSFHTEAFFISIANSNQFGNHFTIAPLASLNDGLLDIVVVNKMHKARMIWSVLKQIKYGQLKSFEHTKYQREGIHYFQTKALTIHNPTLAPLHIDGDPANTASKFEIRIIEKAFRLIVA